MEPDDLLEVLRATVVAVRDATDYRDGHLTGAREGQHAFDVTADVAARLVLEGAGLATLSEESGTHHLDRPLLAVLDPVDGSTNARHRIPWYATSICVLDVDGPLVAVVENLATGQRFEAVRGGGATCDGRPIRPSGVTLLADAVVGCSGLPAGPVGWAQQRALGACALDLCAVACGQLDAFVDWTRPAAHGVWDYLGGLLVCTEAGAPVVDGGGRDLVHRSYDDRRSPAAAASAELLAELFPLIG